VAAILFGALGLLFLSAVTNSQSAQHQASASPPKAKLVFSTMGSGPRYIEGSIEFYRVLSADGKRVKEGSLTERPASIELAPGRYELVSYVRPCDGSCGVLDPPTDECRSKFSIKAGQTLDAVRQQSDKGACTLRIRETAPGRP
jgi:hypothetical protein